MLAAFGLEHSLLSSQLLDILAWCDPNQLLETMGEVTLVVVVLQNIALFFSLTDA
jgi:hypothetical protein